MDGAGEDAARRYLKRRKRAKAYLTLLEAKGTPKEAHGSGLFCLLDGPAELALEGIHIEELCVVDGADRLFSYPDERFPDLETHDKIGKSLDNVFRLRVDKGERTAAYNAWVRNARLLFWRLQDSRTRSETLHKRFVPLFRSTWVRPRSLFTSWMIVMNL